MATLAEIRERLKQQETQGAPTSGSGDNSVYPFWNMDKGESATIRFLPDANQRNDFFWVERQMIKLPFVGVKGDTENKKIIVQVPCMEMYGGSCPVLNEVRGWFKDPTLEDRARQYWKKRSYIFQGFVVNDPLQEDSVPENPIRRFIIGPQIFKIIKTSLLDPDLEELPTDYVYGIDFRLNKTADGSGYADYSTSNWARRERPLSEQEQDAINSFGLYDLGDFLPKKPSDIEVKVIEEMFEASVGGEAYDADRWGQYFRPNGMGMKTGDPNTTSKVVKEDIPFETVAPKAEKKVDSEPEVEQPKATSEESSDSRAKDILQMIRARQTQ